MQEGIEGKYNKLHCLTCGWIGHSDECRFIKEEGTYEGYPLVASCPKCNHIKIDIARHPDRSMIWFDGPITK